MCGKEFHAKPSSVKNGGGKYCSRECHYVGLRTGKFVRCLICDKLVYRSPRSLKHSRSKKYFCGKSCQTKWRNSEFIGEKHANWIHGKQAYRSVLSRHKIPKKCVMCLTEDARILSVHHIDGNRLNNEIKNLSWLCHNCHFLVHHYDTEKEKFMEVLV